MIIQDTRVLEYHAIEIPVVKRISRYAEVAHFDLLRFSEWHPRTKANSRELWIHAGWLARVRRVPGRNLVAFLAVHFEHHDIDTRRRARSTMHSSEIRAMHVRDAKNEQFFSPLLDL